MASQAEFPTAIAPPRGLVRDRVLWLAAAVILVALSWDGIKAVINGWSQPEYSHGWLIPLITLLLLWQRRQRILAVREAGSWSGVALLLAALFLLMLSRLALMAVPQALALILALGGLGLATMGSRAMRLVWAPLAYLVFALPVPNTAYYVIALKLQLISSEIAAWLLQVLGVSVFLEGNIIDLGVYKLNVAEACSGLRYLFPLAAFGFVCAWLYRAPLWARTLIFVSTVPITILTNSARIAITGLLMEYGGTELAEGFLHLFEGWLIFLAALAILLALMWLLARLCGSRARLVDLLDFERMSGGPSPTIAALPQLRRQSLRSAPTVACLGLLLALLPVQALVTARPEMVPTRPGLVTFPLQLNGWRGQAHVLDPEIATIVGADDYLLVDYQDDLTAPAVNLWVAYYGSQRRGGWIHNPRICLPGNGWEFASLDKIAAPAVGPGRPSFLLNRSLVVKGDERILMYFWYEQRGRQLVDEYSAKIYNLIDMITLRRSDAALVRLITPLRPGEPAADGEARLRRLFESAYPHLEPHVGL